MRQLAEASRISPATISRIESGQITQPRLEHLRSLAEVLGVPLDYLVGRTNEVTPNELAAFNPSVKAVVKGLGALSPNAMAQVRKYVDFMETQEGGKQT